MFKKLNKIPHVPHSIKGGGGENRYGFTLVEIVVILGIVTAISALVLFGFGGFNEGVSLHRATRKLALDIRRAQNMAIATAQVSVGDPNPALRIPPAVGVRLDRGEPLLYFLFVDLRPLDFRYGGGGEKISNSNTAFDRGVRIRRLINTDETEYAAVHIIFTSPESDIHITDNNGNTIPGDLISVELASASGTTKKTVTIRTSGQISIK